MATQSTLRWVVTTAFVLAAAGSATAQPAQPGQPHAGQAGQAGQTGPLTDPNAPTVPVGGQVGFERRPQLSLQDELTESNLILGRIDQAAAVVRRQLETARAARDVVKTLCLNDKLSQVDVASRSAVDRQQALQSAVTRKDTELANHEFTILTVLQQRSAQLTAEANQCIGEDLAFIGQTQVTVSYDSTLPPDDTTAPPPAGQSSTFTNPPTCMTCSGP